MKRLAVVASVFLMSACTQQDTDIHRLQIQQITGTNSVYMVGPSTQMVVQRANGDLCFGPAPDAAPERGTAFSLQLPLTVSSTDSESGSTINDDLPLGGRNPNALITRDILFHACLAETRLKLSTEERRAHWKETIDAIIKINGQSLDGASIGSDDFSGSLPTASVPGS